MKTNYKIQGTPNSPVLVFSNSLGSDVTMWDELVSLLLPYFRVLQYDTRGHGASEVTKAPYTMDLLGQDLINLLDDLKIDEVYFCGLSMGGLIGQWLALNHPNRIKKLVLSNTDAKISTAEAWNERIVLVKQKGLAEISESAMSRWFTDAYQKVNPNRVADMKMVFENCDALGYANCCAAIRDTNFRKNLKDISIETLVVTGNEDEVTTVEHAENMVAKIPNAHLKIVKARHLSATECPEEFANLLINFFVGIDAYSRGMHVRRTVLGNEHVNNATSKINNFNGDFQEFISNYAWGEIWTRPELPKHSRSLITIAMLIALNRKAEFKMHIKAAFNNGVTVIEIKEIIMQSGIYCGLPAANEALHAAEEVFLENNIKF